MFSSVPLMPHAVCWAASPGLVWTMVVTNLITFGSYFSICGTLLFLGKRTGKVIARDWIFFLIGFALFIVACGSTHLMEVVTTWSPVFWLDAWANIITAVLSAYVAVQLARRVSAISFGINDYAARLGDVEAEKRRMQESLLQSQKLEDWSRLSVTMAHEIANPLDAVHNLLYLIRSQQDVSPEIVELAATADQEASRVLSIARSSLSFFRQSAKPESVNLKSEVESIRYVLGTLLTKRDFHLSVVSSGDVAVEAFAGEARQVLLNLIRNAFDASSRAGSEVCVKLTGQLHQVEIVVSDQGTGIPAAQLPLLFQFGKSTKGEQGHGMGLWTAKHIVERHNGTIRVESEPGLGTSFYLEWPRVQATFEPEEAMLTRMS